MLLLLATLLACVGDREDLDDPVPAVTPPASPRFEVDPELDGLRIEISEAEGAGAGGEAAPVAETTPLSEAETKALLSRLEPLPEEPGDRQSFALREASRPPPRTGARVAQPFPVADRPPAPEVDEGSLTVVRHAPDGAVPIAPHLSVTFSQPMVPVTSQAEAAARHPVEIVPAVEGQWRWIGSKTLLFEPTALDRFPMATRYTVTVPEGTSSEVGGSLAEAASWTFTTPPPTLTEAWPVRGPHELQPPIFLAFDQRIDPEAMARHVTLTAGQRSFALRAATAAEIERDEPVRRRVERAQEDRFLVLVPVAPLPSATEVHVTVEPGAPSAEGPLTTTEAQRRSFTTYGPLEVADTDCWHGERGCQPGGLWSIRMSNPVDPESFDPDAFTVEPALDTLRVVPSGQWLQVYNDGKPHTTYEVTLPATLVDVFGQTLGQDETVSFRTGGMADVLAGPGSEMVVLDPAAPPSFPVWSVNHDDLRLRVYRVTPETLPGLSQWMREARHDGSIRGEPPLERLADQVLPIEGPADEMVETAVDLRPWLEGDRGQLFLWIEPRPQKEERWERTDVFAWVQATGIGLSAFSDAERMLAWTTSLDDGAPVAGVEVSLLGDGARTTGTSGEEGLATLDLLPSHDGPHYLVARTAADLAILPDALSWWNARGSWAEVQGVKDEVRWFVFDDRHLYRPSETVRVKGWIRAFQPRPEGDLSLVPGLPTPLTWVAHDASGNEIGRGRTETDARGGFDLALELPDTPNLGTAVVSLTADEIGGQWFHHFEIQEFRRPEFEVTASADPGPYVLGDHAVVTVEAAYYAGGALPSAPVAWTVYTEAATYQPPGWEGFRFGSWVPWWRGFWQPPSARTPPARLEGRTNPLGQHHLKVDFLAVNPPRPWNVRAEASVTDVNRQRWTATRTVLVHPSAAYVGMRTERPYLSEGEKLEVDVVVVDLDGHLLPNTDAEVRLARIDWEFRAGEYHEVDRDVETCGVAVGTEPARCTFTPEQGGSYRLKATVADAAGRPNETELRIWVSGGGRPQRGLEQDQVTLVPDQETYRPGGTAEVFVQAPFFPAEGLWTLRRHGIAETGRFTMDGPTATIRVPIGENHVPDVRLEVDLVGSAPRTDDKGEPVPDAARRPAHASGHVELQVPPLDRTLTVEVAPREDTLSPGGRTTVDLRVVDAAGEPVQAEVALVAVDEAVLALSGYRIPDPIEVFYVSAPPGVSEMHLRDLLQLARPALVVAEDRMERGAMLKRGARRAMPMAAPPAPPPAGGMEEPEAVEMMALEGDGGEAPIEVRTDFEATALFAPRVTTGADGRAEVPLDLPDSLTRYRLMAVAVSGARAFGSGEATVTARLPLMVRPSPPRFLNFGDRVELPVVIQNQTDAPLPVSLALRMTNAHVTGTDDVRTAGRRTEVPANDRVEVRIPVAAEEAGTARFQVAVASGDAADAATFDLPVWTPATAEAFATTGTIDQGAVVQPVKAPADVWTQFGGLEITTSSTALQALTDALVYLVQYPYECNEQIASRVMAVAALRDVLTAFEAEQLPPAAELEAAVARDLERLHRRQLDNGGWGLWGTGRDWPYPTVHVAHALARAEAKGYELPPGMKDETLRYLRAIERHIPEWYSPEAKWAIRAYALRVRQLLGDRDAAEASRLVREVGVDELPIEALGWVMPVLEDAATVAAIERRLVNGVSETAGAAHFVTGYADGEYVLLHSDRRADGVLLEALLETRPDHDLIPKLVEGLLGHRKQGRWGNTQENAFVLLAMDRYFQVYESETPDFVARTWLGEQYAGDHAFRGRTTERAHTEIPMGYLTDPGGTQDLVLSMDGDQGRLYYRIGLRYAPRDLSLEPADHGFTVQRVYESIDDPDDVTRDADGTWRIRSGARVRTRVTMVAPARRVHVMLVDPLPAGLEVLNPALATTGTLPEDPAAADPWAWWRGPWYTHQNIRDERAEAYTPLLWDGVYTYTYTAIATTPGRFVVPPAKAEEMYSPETFGRSATNRVIVE